MDVDPRWYETFFETDEWLLLAQARNPAQTDAEVAFLAEQLPAGGRVLDLACGTGRVAVPLARRGFVVAGLDISGRALDVARTEAPDLEFRQGDMRRLPWPDASFDGVINIWTAFGYYQEQPDDEQALAEVARVLRPGGVFVLDTVNLSGLHRKFQPEGWSELDDGTLMLERRAYDPVSGRSRAHWTFVHGNGARRELAFDHRLYSPVEYAQLLDGAGLAPVRWFGGFDGSELTLDAWRLIVCAERA